MGNRDGTSELQITEQSRLWLTPNAALIVASLIALSAFFVSAWIVTHQPWLGISLVGGEKGLRVVEVVENGPSANILAAGDVILTLADQKGNAVQLQSQDIIEDADNIPTLKERDIFRDRQSAIYQILLQPVVDLTLNDGRTMRVQPQSYRPLVSMPVSFWLLVFYSIIALLVGTTIWSIKQKEPSAKYLLLSGLGVVFLLNSSNIFTSRELALDGIFYLRLIFSYHLGNDLFTLGMIGLVWNYPKPISRFPIIPVLIVFMSFFMLNETLEWMELPGNSVLIQVPAYWILGIICIAIQWVRSRGNPVDRAATKLLTMVLLIIVFIIAATDLVAVFTSKAPTISLTESFFALFIFYITLTLVIYRYHLFDIDRWWIEIWLWFFTGVVIVMFDMAFVMIANMASPYALAASVIAVGWLYFPVRQWVWEKLFHRKRNSLEEWVPLLVGHFVNVDHKNDQHVWETVLNDVFRPLSIALKKQEVAEVKVTGNGVCLLTPCLAPACGMELYYADKGRRLFNRDDISLAQALFNITEQALAQQENYKHGMFEERKRIMRDLHDDIGGRLLTLVHAKTGESHAASEALKSLREIIYSLDTELQLTLNTAVARWRIEAQERCEQADISFEWHWEEQEQDIRLTPRQHLNLTLIMREGLSNMLKHAKAERNMVDLRVEGGTLQVTLVNDGGVARSKQIKLGKGLQNMRARTEELGGEFRYTYEAGIFCVKFSVPVNEMGGGLMYSVLVVEDHDDSRVWWERHLGDVFPKATVSGVVTLAAARELLGQQQFTLAILDINLPDGSGIDLLKEITLNYPEMYSVICSIYDDDRHIFSSLRAGAKGYLLKDQPREKQLIQLKDIMHGQPPLSPGVARRILSYFSEGKMPQHETKNYSTHLSDREKEVLTLIAKGYSRPEVTKLLNITLNTVSGYTKAIYQKLNISNRAEAVVEAVKLGLIDRDIE